MVWQSKFLPRNPLCFLFSFFSPSCFPSFTSQETRKGTLQHPWIWSLFCKRDEPYDLNILLRWNIAFYGNPMRKFVSVQKCQLPFSDEISYFTQGFYLFVDSLFCVVACSLSHFTRRHRIYLAYSKAGIHFSFQCAHAKRHARLLERRKAPLNVSFFGQLVVLVFLKITNQCPAAYLSVRAPVLSIVSLPHRNIQHE